MKMLICSDGMPAAESAIRLGASLAAPLKAEVFVLGVAEKPEDESALQQALDKQVDLLRTQGVSSKIGMCVGDPVRQILGETTKVKYDLVIVGARKTGATGL